ncbi:hypothetical protein PBY51_022902 [Eleginops maclovinus]|uniref:Uncharacterized protein n=1 Tax=Eleginops maclovinus TaxID=56733 RepID=A0AAN7XC03_ELEMC|nr:hypothetical protein PBY51_022902 [Eleginops maclovinus]
MVSRFILGGCFVQLRYEDWLSLQELLGGRPPVVRTRGSIPFLLHSFHPPLTLQLHTPPRSMINNSTRLEP